jgi:hypothetical protein
MIVNIVSPILNTHRILCGGLDSARERSSVANGNSNLCSCARRHGRGQTVETFSGAMSSPRPTSHKSASGKSAAGQSTGSSRVTSRKQSNFCSRSHSVSGLSAFLGRVSPERVAGTEGVAKVSSNLRLFRAVPVPIETAGTAQTKQKGTGQNRCTILFVFEVKRERAGSPLAPLILAR